MRKKLIPILLVVTLLTANVYAAESPAPVPMDEPAVVTVADITPQEQNKFTGTLPDILPLDVQIKDEDGSKLLIKTFEVASDTAPQELVEENLTRGGVEYTLREILKETLQGGTNSRTESKIVTVSAPSDKNDDIIPLLPESLDYNGDGYIGKLTLDADSIKTEVESTKAYSYTVSDTRSYTGLARNDPALIEKTVRKNGMTLSLCNIKWSGGSENDPSPVYSATAYYAGKASGKTADGYIVTASYSGEVSKPTPGDVRYNIIYEPIQPPVLPEIPQDFDWSGIVTVVFIALGIAAIAAAIYFTFRFLRTRKKNTGFDMGMAEAKPKRRKPHALGYLKPDSEFFFSNDFFQIPKYEQKILTMEPIPDYAREAVRRFIFDEFEDRLLGMQDYRRWGRRFKQRCIDLTIPFWAQVNMGSVMRASELEIDETTTTRSNTSESDNSGAQKTTSGQKNSGTMIGKQLGDSSSRSANLTTVNAADIVDESLEVDWSEAADGFQETRTRAGDTSQESNSTADSTTSVSNSGNSRTINISTDSSEYTNKQFMQERRLAIETAQSLIPRAWLKVQLSGMFYLLR